MRSFKPIYIEALANNTAWDCMLNNYNNSNNNNNNNNFGNPIWVNVRDNLKRKMDDPINSDWNLIIGSIVDMIYEKA